jgi:hypothetical protein
MMEREIKGYRLPEVKVEATFGERKYRGAKTWRGKLVDGLRNVGPDRAMHNPSPFVEWRANESENVDASTL